MATTSLRCPVLGAHVTRITDLEGAVIQVICAEYDSATRSCRLKTSALQGGPLEQLLQRTSEGTLASRSTTCDFA